MKLKYLYSVAVATLLCLPAQAQLKLDGGETKAPYIIPSTDSAVVAYTGDYSTIHVASNCEYNIQHVANDWLTVRREKNGNISLFATYNYLVAARQDSLMLASSDGKYERKVYVTQSGNTMSGPLYADVKISGVSGVANQAQGGYDISKSLDGNVATFYHSPWGSTPTTFPVILTYNFNTAQHVDYAIYTPRQDGNNNGNWGQVLIEYRLEGSNEWITLKDTNFGMGSGAASISFGETGIDNVKSVRYTIKSGYADDGSNGFASCAEMGFYQINTVTANEMNTFFVDKLCTQLKPNVTRDMVVGMKNEVLKRLAYALLDGNYSTDYRVSEYRAYKPVGELLNELKTSYTYNNHENPTGITFEKGERVAVIVDGLENDGISLQVRNFGPSEYNTNWYALKNGINVLTIINKGNGYIDYYTSNFQHAPNVNVHFVLGKQNGYFDLTKGHTNNDFMELLANATGEDLDLVGQYAQCVFPVETLRANTADGRWTALQFDSITYYERQLMGLFKHNRDYGNRQAIITVPKSGGLYHANNDGCCIPFQALAQPTTSDPNYFDYWGMAHELGHVNQTAGVLWIGLTEVTNNIMSAYCEHKLKKNGFHRLENESQGFRYYNYLNNGIMKEAKLLPSVGGDVFVTLIPFYQLLTYTEGTGLQPDAYPDLYETMRTTNVPAIQRGNTSENYYGDGQRQIYFCKQWCDITQTDYTDFFIQTGFLKPVNEDIGDYDTRRLHITQDMIDECINYVKAKNYPTPPAGLVFIDTYNKNAFRDKVTVPANIAIGTGCIKSGSNIQIQHASWPNVVGFKTYDATGNLIHMTNYGHGYAGSNNHYEPTYTVCAWNSAESPARITAVSYDGSEVTCYQE